MKNTIYITHYKGNGDRRKYIESMPKIEGISLEFIEDFDAGEFDVESQYAFDEAMYRKMTESIKEILVGYVVGLRQMSTSPWADCVFLVKEKNLSLAQLESQIPWIRPRPLKAAEVSLFLKHRLAWEKIASGHQEWGIVAEDDILYKKDTRQYFERIVESLPEGFGYIDLAGGCGLLPRNGNRLLNNYFYEIDPPRDRTTCCAILSKSFAKAILELHLPICLPVDWTLTYAFSIIRPKVYWLAPLLFGHGSEMNVY